MIQNNDAEATEKLPFVDKKEYAQAVEKTQQYINTAIATLQDADAGKAGRDYLASRGISMEQATLCKIGYIANYAEGMNSPAIIIPTGPLSYTARSITKNASGEKVRKLNAGKSLNLKAGIFGIDTENNIVENQAPIVFILEGEIDAISVMEMGYPAIATGGGTSKGEIVETLKARGTPGAVYVIIPDNDRLDDGSPDLTRGIKAGRDLYGAMKEAGLKVALIDVLGEDWPQQCKDCNDFLREDRAGFALFLNQTKLDIEEKMLDRVSGYMQDFVSQIAGNTPPISTHFDTLDKILGGGLHPGLIILGAISSLGKTTFCLNLADKMAQAGQDVIFYSLEMSKFELISKIISRRTALDCLINQEPMNNAKTNLGVSDFSRWAGYSEDEKNLLQKALNEFSLTSAQHLYIKEGLQSIGTETIRRDVQKHIFFTGREPIVFVDYTQILKTPDTHLTDKQKTDENVVELKRISRDLNVPIVGVSSFNRDNYTEPVTMRAFKESGAIEYTSDILIGLQYDGMDYMEDESDKQRTNRIRKLFKENELAGKRGQAVAIQCKILKNRSGSKADCIFDYFPMFNLYVEYEE